MGIKRSVIAGTLALILLAPVPAGAHPKLKRSEPAAGATLQISPTVIALYFSERPELALTTVSISGPGGVDTLSGVAAGGAEPGHLSVRLPRALIPGRYTVSWRTAASDGHPVRGSFEFTVIATATLTPDETPAAPPAPPATASPPVEAGEVNVQTPFQVLLRAVWFMSLIVVIGAVAFRFGVVPRARDLGADVRAALIDRSALIGAVAAGVLLLLSPIRFQLQAVLMEEHASGAGVRTLMMDTRWGSAWMLSTVGAVVTLAGLVLARRRLGNGWIIAAGGAIALAFSPALTGHAGASPYLAPLAVTVDALHIAGAAGWLGSLLYVVAAGIPELRFRENAAANVAKLVNAFSPTALAFASLVVISGITSAWLRLGGLEPLWTSPYGRILLLKLLALSGVIATGAYNWRRMRPALGVDAATAKFGWSARVELAIGVLVILVTAILVATPTPVDGG